MWSFAIVVVSLVTSINAPENFDECKDTRLKTIPECWNKFRSRYFDSVIKSWKASVRSPTLLVIFAQAMVEIVIPGIVLGSGT